MPTWDFKCLQHCFTCDVHVYKLSLKYPQLHVFCADEANRLYEWKDQGTLATLLAVLVLLSKQERLCHVIMASSDDLFVNWLQQRKCLAWRCTSITTISHPPAF